MKEQKKKNQTVLAGGITPRALNVLSAGKNVGGSKLKELLSLMGKVLTGGTWAVSGVTIKNCGSGVTIKNCGSDYAGNSGISLGSYSPDNLVWLPTDLDDIDFWNKWAEWKDNPYKKFMDNENYRRYFDKPPVPVQKPVSWKLKMHGLQIVNVDAPPNFFQRFTTKILLGFEWEKE